MLSTLLQVDPLRTGNSFNSICVYIYCHIRSSALLVSPLEFLQSVSVNSELLMSRRNCNSCDTTNPTQKPSGMTEFQGKGRRRHLGSGFSKLHEDLQRNYKQKLVNGANGRQLSLFLKGCQMSFSLSQTCLPPSVLYFPPAAAQLS